MTAVIAPVGVLYDAEDLQPDDLSIFLRFQKGLAETSTVRGTDSIVPALAGRIEGLRIKDLLKVELAGWVQPAATASTLADQLASFQANRAYLRDLFSPDRGLAELIAVLEDGTLQTVQARPLNMVFNEIIPSLYAEVSVELEAFDDWVIFAGS